jgi:predicted amino acid racemase
VEECYEKPLQWQREKRVTIGNKNEIMLAQDRNILAQIRDNARMLSELYGKKGISIMGVSKAVLGEPSIVKAMIQGGVRFIADSRIENIEKMKAAGISTQFVLLRTSIKSG